MSAGCHPDLPPCGDKGGNTETKSGRPLPRVCERVAENSYYNSKQDGEARWKAVFGHHLTIVVVGASGTIVEVVTFGRPSAHHTGDARADYGGVAVSGVVTAPITVHTTPPARSAYQEQVRRIAPPELLDRETELVELARFAVEGGMPSYAWWRAPAWAGKSALMSWFVLHPPEHVRVLGFFITARFAGQSDRAAFADVMIEQLAELLGEYLPALLTEATRDAHLLDLLARAAAWCERRRERLVILVDGLDEDRGVVTGPDAHSIAAMLPVRPPVNMRIIVAGRPNPPIPSDVPDDHPLRDPAVIHELDRSPRAEVVRHDAERELKRLLRGTSAEQDLLGLLTAAGGGLSGSDLVELTGLSAWDVDDHLTAVSGRTFVSRAGRWRPEAQLFVLGHEELQQQSAAYLGPVRLLAYRERLYRWYDSYRGRHWPPDTPEYLLRGYYRLLRATGDLPRMLECATDQARHDRMLDLTGGDSAALAEITQAQEAVAASEQPDLAGMAKLALHRELLTRRNTDIPTVLPAVWARLDRPVRAEALARSIRDPARRAQALALVVRLLAERGDPDTAERITRFISDTTSEAHAVAAIAKAAAENRDGKRAESLARKILRPYERSFALATVAKAMAEAGDFEHAQAVATSIDDSFRQVRALCSVARSMAAAEPSQAVALVDQANTVARSIGGPHKAAHALANVARTVAEMGDLPRAHVLLDEAVALASSVTEPARRLQAWTAIARASARMAASVFLAGDPPSARLLADRAETLTELIDDSQARAAALTAVAGLLAAGDADRAEQVADSLDTLPRRARALAAVATAVAATGDRDRAAALIRSVPTVGDSTVGWGVRATLARAAAGAGDLDHAEALARSIVPPVDQVWALADVARQAAGMGEIVRAAALADEAQRGARSITDPSHHVETLAALAIAMAAAGQPAEASALVAAIQHPYRRARVLTDMTLVVAQVGDPSQAAAVANLAEEAARSGTDQAAQDRSLAVVVAAVAVAGDPQRAESLARSITSRGPADQALAAVSQIVGSAGYYDRAERLARSIAVKSRRGQALANLARAVGPKDPDRGRRIALSLPGPFHQARTLAAVARVTANKAGPVLVEEAAFIAAAIPVKSEKAVALAAVARAAASLGAWERADALIASIDKAFQKAHALADIARMAARSRDVGRARLLAGVAEHTARSIRDPSQTAWALAAVAKALATTGDDDRAVSVAASIMTRYQREQALSAVALIVAEAGDFERAEVIARSIETPAGQAIALVALIDAVPPDRARSLAVRALQIGDWRSCLGTLAQMEPDVVEAITTAYMTSRDDAGA